MAHLIEAKTKDEQMDVEESDTVVTDAQIASISHSRALVSPTDAEYELINQRLTKLMAEGRGECIFEVGLGTDPPAATDNGQPAAEDAEAASGLNLADFEASVATLRSIAESQDADCVLLRERALSGVGSGTSGGDIHPDARRTGQYLLRKRADPRVTLNIHKYKGQV